MSSRQQSKAAARQACVAREAQAHAAATRRRRLQVLAGAILGAVALGSVAVALTSGGGSANAASGGKLNGTSISRSLFAGIPPHGTVLGQPNALVRVIEFADLQCPYCQEYTVQALPSLVRDYVRTGKVQMQFEDLSFIGAGSVQAGHYAVAAAAQNKLWNFIDLMYLNQGTENSGYVTPAYLRRLLQATPGVNVSAALSASQTPAAGGTPTDGSRGAAAGRRTEPPH